ncbi:efflux RND transporter periplasmic adaptor subunit [Roseateles cellulosilyticus]|uniref:Efflux RND transporter periplasmic adaptor subunit n=1 Tax=Pelomonas cellulosilytica TaxID=2906762 RepID=A0ABS8XML0_9BURK|nr:efflux RND transporter periplasmic adaptor subunit [Pelomonas sp. P8]MCE4553058.1 efflux RND transporter periplasmic adaptor subunit [Pelomonas sp. P8]
MKPLLLLATLAAAPALAADYVGIVHARHKLSLSLPVTGIVAKVAVEPGQKVGAGQALVLLDERAQALEEQRRRIQADDVSELRATEERLKVVQPLAEDARKLAASRGALSREDAARNELDFIATRGRLAQLQAQKIREKTELQLAETDRLQRRLVAPVAGVVTKVGIDVGEWAKPGDTMVELVDASVLHLRVNIPAAAARRLKDGQALPVAIDGGDTVNGNVSFISPVTDAASGLVEVRVRFNNPAGRVAAGSKGIVKLDGGPAK